MLKIPNKKASKRTVMDLRIKLVQIFATFAIFSACAVAAEMGIVGRKAPRIVVRQWITPNPPTKAALEGKVYVVEFWAAWCVPCINSIPHMIELADKYRKSGVLFIALSQDSSVAPVREMIQRRKINYHVGMDDGVSKKFLFGGIPTAFVISHTGTVVWQGHPTNRNFENAILKALESAPKPFLAGVELGPYENLRSQLSGGRDFAKEYHRLKTEAEDSNSQNTDIAGKIIEAIDAGIDKKIQEAQKLRVTDPAAAFELYRQIVKNYKGIDVVKPAIVVYTELENDEQVQNEVRAGRAFRRVERFLAECSGCSNCGDFRLECKDCRRFNETALSRVERILTAICSNYKGTKAAKVAQERLKELNNGSSSAGK